VGLIVMVMRGMARLLGQVVGNGVNDLQCGVALDGQADTLGCSAIMGRLHVDQHLLDGANNALDAACGR
jgi:hypothetical protein